MIVEPKINISVCPPSQFSSELPGLAVLLKDTVEENISLNFCLPFSIKDAEDWWRDLEGGIKTGKEILILAHAEHHNIASNEARGRRLVGCVIFYLSQKTNAPHRGEIGKLLVKKDERGRQVDISETMFIIDLFDQRRRQTIDGMPRRPS